MTMPVDVSTEGWRIDSLLSNATVVIALIAGIALVWIAVAVIAGVRRDKPGAELSPGIARGLPIGIAAVMLIGLDGYLFIASNRDWAVLSDSAAAEAAPGAVRIEINAQQWGWNVRHPGPDGRFATADDPVDFNRLVVPVDAPVVIQAGSSDVVHGLWIPNLRIKRDLIPGRIAELWFQATAVGRYPIACAQFCGVSHYKMNGVVEVVDRADYEAYVAAESADSVRIDQERARAYEEEPALQPPLQDWPRFAPEPPRRDWGWEWVEL